LPRRAPGGVLLDGVDDTPGAGISSRAPTDYQAIETAIETKIMSGSVGWQTIEASGA
jgi:hypothetical protein